MGARTEKGGVLLNFDANYGLSDFTDLSELPDNHAHQEIDDSMMRECEEIKRQLPISSYSRPAWDLETLGAMKLQEFLWIWDSAAEFMWKG